MGGRQCEDAVEQRGPRGQCEQHDRREDRRRRGAASPPPRRQPHPRAVTAAQGQAEEVETAQAVALAARGGTRSGALLGRCFRGVRRRRSARVHAGVPQLGLRAGLGGRVWGMGNKHGPSHWALVNRLSRASSGSRARRRVLALTWLGHEVSNGELVSWDTTKLVSWDTTKRVQTGIAANVQVLLRRVAGAPRPFCRLRSQLPFWGRLAAREGAAEPTPPAGSWGWGRCAWSHLC